MASRQTCLRSVVVCFAKIRICCASMSENKFSPCRTTTTTIYDCNNLSAVCSRLRQPFESRRIRVGVCLLISFSKFGLDDISYYQQSVVGCSSRSSPFVLCGQRNSFSWWRLGRLVYDRLLFALQRFVFVARVCLKRNFRYFAQQARQSTIATTSLRSALNCGSRSSHAVKNIIFR